MSKQEDEKSGPFTCLNWSQRSILTQMVIQILLLFALIIAAEVHLINQASRHYRVFLADYLVKNIEIIGLVHKEERLSHMTY